MHRCPHCGSAGPWDDVAAHISKMHAELLSRSFFASYFEPGDDLPVSHIEPLKPRSGFDGVDIDAAHNLDRYRGVVAE